MHTIYPVSDVTSIVCSEKQPARTVPNRGRVVLGQQLRSGAFPSVAAVKGQIVGPLTVGLTLDDHQKRPSYYDHDLQDVLVRTLALNVGCQVSALLRSGVRPIIFLDDPNIGAWGTVPTIDDTMVQAK
jgi:hypothetical protein